VKILADENLDGPIVAWLREQGHDVLWAAESHPSKNDAFLIDLAVREDRLFITSDKDFGEHIYRLGRRLPGVVFLRLRGESAADLLAKFQAAWLRIATQVHGNYIVVKNDKIRIRPMV
jgi:predicted nuclease of predicted toxin-antitoxin system